MSTGQILFYAGVALLIATILLAIFFFIKKPQYTPEGVVSITNQTQRLRNGYPTDPLTRGKPVAQPSSPPQVRPAGAGGTVLLDQETAMLGRGTAVLDQETTPLSQGTKKLIQGTETLVQGTVKLEQETEKLATETKKLTPDTEKLVQGAAPMNAKLPPTSRLDSES